MNHFLLCAHTRGKKCTKKIKSDARIMRGTQTTKKIVALRPNRSFRSHTAFREHKQQNTKN